MVFLRKFSPLPFLLLSSLSLLTFAASNTCTKGNFLKSGKCLACPPGTFQHKDAAIQCIPCPAGTYNPVSGAQGPDICLSCPSGTFSEKERAKSLSECKACPSGTNSQAAAIKCGKCPSGTFINGQESVCSQCTGMGIAPKDNSLECIQCARYDNTLANNERTKCVKCAPGFGAHIYDRKCEKCKDGQYNDGTFSFCRPCGPGMGTNAGGTGCIECPTGTAATGFSKACTNCPTKQNVGVTGSAACLTTGQACSDSFFKTKNGACKRCASGERLNERLMACVKCNRNEVSLGGLVRACKKCPRTQVPSENSKICVCPVGSTMFPNGTCKMCGLGRYVELHSTQQFDEIINAESCNECPDGTFSRGGLVGRCEVCPDGFQPNKRKTECRKCPKGLRSYVFSNGRYSTSRCVVPQTNCPPGEERIGVFSDGILYACGRKCSKNEIADYSLGRVRCVSCPSDSFFRFSEFGSADLPGYCLRCPKGKALPDGSGCEDCPSRSQLLHLPNQLGSRCGCSSDQFRTSALSFGECTPFCPEGQGVTFGTVYTDDECTPCPAGTSRFFSEEETCSPCSIGFFAAKPGSERCKKCPAGQTTLYSGAKSCISE